MRPDTDSSIQKEFPFTVQDFNKIVALIHKVAGISLAASKKEMVYSRVARRLRATGHNSFEEYLNHLERDTGHAEWQNFVNALTTNLTAFFREEHHFPVLADYARKHPKELSVWCCAASTGEEPYSIAMTLCEAYASAQPPVKILATDIDTNVLSTASAGMYALNKLDKLNAEQLSKYFLKGKNSREGMAKIKPEIARLVTFKQLNLLEQQWGMNQVFDVIFCRNIMIYFDKPTQSKILSRFEQLLKPGGLLFAGHSENFTYVSNAFKLEGKTVYTRLAT